MAIESSSNKWIYATEKRRQLRNSQRLPDWVWVHAQPSAQQSPGFPARECNLFALLPGSTALPDT